MARPCLVYPLMIVIVIAHLCSCVRRANYAEYYLESEKICHILNEKRQLEVRNGTAAIVAAHHMFDRWLVRSDRNCTFVVKAEKGEGLLAVIHKMFFRTNDDGKTCLDYIRFKKSDNQYTNKICGEIDRSQMYLSSDSSASYDIDKFAEFDPIHKKLYIFRGIDFAAARIETEIFISKEPVSKGQSLDLSIVYTPYRNCDKTNREQYEEVKQDICIRKEYVCDKIINCPVNMCQDEKLCVYDMNQYTKEDTATKVTVGAVTTMILCFIIFVMCLWICKKSQKLCWSSDCAGPNVCSRPASLPQDAEAIPGSNRAVPTAPMLEVALSSPVADKDLPPSYDSLFPEQSNPIRT